MITLSNLANAIQESVLELELAYPDLYVDHAGIKPYVEGPTEINRYDPTPRNTTLFGWTGGDGVHFSLLEISDTIQPIVMTVPTRFSNSIGDFNWILGENLNEFLSLGYYNGWFYLENLCYDFKKALKFYGSEFSHKGYHNGADEHFLERMRTKLKYNYLPIKEERLEALKNQYFDKLVFDKEFINRLNNKIK